MKKVIVLTGPTGVGKSEVAIKLAKIFDLEVISADSVSVFRELNIGSAKLTDNEMNGIKHHLINIRSVSENYSVASFQQDFYDIEKNLKTPFLVGGSALYITGAIYSYKFEGNLRDENYTNLVKDKTTEELYQEIINIDNNNQVDKDNRQRVVRMHEKIVHNKTILDSKATLKYDPLIIYLDIDRTILKERITRRLDIMLDNGFLQEVKDLNDKSLYSNSIGYKDAFLYIKGELTYKEMYDNIIIHSMQLAKKQKTWFKNKLSTNFIDTTNKTVEQISFEVSSLIKGFL
jgi:tRNA dimethylallyltransferase